MKLIFLSKKHEVDDAFSFVFKPVESITWLAGQSIRLEINELERRFSIASAPFEWNITIVTRLSGSDFKNALDSLKPGDEIDGYNIEGTFVWDETSPNKFLIAGGIGITAFYPMLKQRNHDDHSLHARLVYTSRDNNFLFEKELRELAKKHPELTLEFCAGRRFSKKVAEKYKKELLKSQVYISGPEAMVQEVTKILVRMGIKEQMLKRDMFTGFHLQY